MNPELQRNDSPLCARTVLLLAGVLALCSAAARSGPQQDVEAAPAPSTAGPTGSTGVTQIAIDGPLDVGALSLVRRASEQALERGDRLVVVLDTPGGEVELMWQVARALDDAHDRGVRTIAWVNDRAVSAGALVAFACDKIYMRAVAQIGSATPVMYGPGGVQELPPDSDLREKQYSHLRSGFRNWAEDHGRSGLLAEAMVDPEVEVLEVRRDHEWLLMSRSEYDDALVRGESIEFGRVVVPRGTLLNLGGPRAVELGMADGIADSEDELYDKIGCSGAVPNRVERTGSEELASWLDMFSGLLLVAGLVLAYLELKTPGFGIPGIASIVCFAVFLFGRYLVGLADVPHMVIVAVGVVLVFIELFVLPGTLWFGLGGIVLVLGGLIWSNLGPGFDLRYPMDRELAMDSVWRTVLSAGLAMVLMLAFSRFLPKTPVLRGLVLDAGEGGDWSAGAMQEAHDAHREVAREGAHGRALTDLRPVGKVVLDERTDLDFEARSSGPALDSGTRVRVLEVRGGRLLVEALPEAESPPDRIVS